ncbi:MAG: thiamine-phosphate kinase [Alphaproteobacteria bacterium]|nr:thiamine-phosphate kinase [Alphaproteobacteria bacterium]
MKLPELGGEFAFIDRIARQPKNKNVLKGIGDDCAVVQINDNKLHLYTVDMLVEGNHFSTDYFTPYNIGIKAMESNVSDIASMGGKVLYGLVSLALPDDISVEFLDEFYRGMYDAAKRYSFDIIGGDTTGGDRMTVSITLVGEVSPSCLRLRSMAEVGDLIVASGALGGSMAGLRLFQKNIKGCQEVKRYHTTPECSMNRLDKIVPIAKAMADVSDGLASEVRNICKESNVGAKIIKNKIPLCDGVQETAELIGEDPYDYALFGGEDFKLIYTVAPENKNKITGTVVGEIIAGKDVMLDDKKLNKFGWNHFTATIKGTI